MARTFLPPPYWTRAAGQSMVLYQDTIAVKLEEHVLQSILIGLVLLTIALFVWDIRRRSLKHSHTVQKAKEEISAKTHMTATISSFADGKANEVILGASEDCALFFYYIIANGVIVRQYIIATSNIVQASLVINGEKRNIAANSGHKLAVMQASEVAKHLRMNLKPETLRAIKSIVLHVAFRSEDGTEKVIPVHVYKESTQALQDALPKTFENAVCWQQYLTLLEKSSAGAPE